MYEDSLHKEFIIKNIHNKFEMDLDTFSMHFDDESNEEFLKAATEMIAESVGEVNDEIEESSDKKK